MTTTTNAVKTASAAPSVRNTERKPIMLKRRIGSTDYIIAVRYSQSGKEDLQDKILRLIESEVRKLA
jgi:hypothetical protein